MKNLNLEINNINYVLLEVEQNQNIDLVYSSYYVKTVGEIEEVKLRTDFDKFKYSMISTNKKSFEEFIEFNKVDFDNNKKYYLFERYNK